MSIEHGRESQKVAIGVGSKTRRELRKVVEGKVFFLVACVIFRATLDLSYTKYVSVYYGYSGFDLVFDYLPYFVSWVIFVSCLFITPYKLNKLSDYFFVTANLSLVAPLTSLYGLTDKSIYPLMVCVCAISLTYFMANSRFIKVPHVPLMRSGGRIAFYLSACMVVFLVIWCFASGAVRNFNLDLSKVYEFRDVNAELTNIGILAYINNWVYKVFTIFLLAYALYKRWYVMVLLCLVLQVFFFGISGQKSVLFMPVLVFGVWYYFRKSSSLVIMPLALAAIVGVSLALSIFTEHTLIGSLFIRRVFYVPSALTYDYFDFFEVHPHLYWGDSVLSWLVHYDYNQSLSELIGGYIGTGENANNGFIASGYAQAGLIGVFIYVAILGLVLRFLDVVGRSCDALWLAIALTIIPLRSLVVASDLPVIMITHGFLIAIGLLLLVRRARPNKDVNQ